MMASMRPPLVSTAHLRPGQRVRIEGLEADAFQKFNGTMCTVQNWDPSVGKWVVKLDSGAPARLPKKNLRVLPLPDTGGLAPGMKVRIVDLESETGSQYNDTVATIAGWNEAAGKWNVRLFTGVGATIASANLVRA